MGLASGAALGFLALTPVIVLLYLLKLRRKELVVSSTLLWSKSLHDLVANAPLQRLRNNLLMYLQILALILLVLGLSQPFLSHISADGRQLIFLIDTSASMRATDVEGTRFDQAVEVVRGMLRDKSRGDNVMLVAFGAQTRVVQSFTRDASEAEHALARLRPTDGRTDVSEALLLAAEVAKKQTDTHVYVISDGVFTNLDWPVGETLPLQYIKIGQGGNNVGITGLEYRTSFDSPLDSQVFVSVSNYSDQPQERTVSYYINDELVDARTLTLEIATRNVVIFTNRGSVDGVARFTLDGEDDLAVDDVAHGILTPLDRRRAWLVSDGNYFLEPVIALHPGLVLERVAPADYGYDPDVSLTIFDNVAPPEGFLGAALVINATPPVSGAAFDREQALPTILDWDRAHPVGRYVDYGGLIITKANLMELPVWSRTVLEAPQGPLIATMEQGPTRILFLAFDVMDSNWPFLFSFPVFMSNALDWLLQGGGSGHAFQFEVGSPIPIVTREPNQRVAIIGPDNRRFSLETNINRTGYFADSDLAGIYQVQAGEERWAFAVNLVSDEESNIVPVDEVTIGEQRVMANVSPGVSRRELWKWLVLGGLGLLVLEWWIYTRRTWL